MQTTNQASRLSEKVKVLLLRQEVQFCGTFPKLYNFSSLDSPEMNYFWAYFAKSRVLLKSGINRIK